MILYALRSWKLSIRKNNNHNDKHKDNLNNDHNPHLNNKHKQDLNNKHNHNKKKMEKLGLEDSTYAIIECLSWLDFVYNTDIIIYYLNILLTNSFS